MKEIVKADAPAQVGRQQKKRHRRNLRLYYILVAALVLVAGIVLSLTVLFKTDKIIINGETPYLSADIIEASQIKLGENIITADFSTAQENILNSLLYVETAEIKKKFPTTVVISVTQTTPCFNISTDDGFLLVSEHGKILDYLADPVEGLLTVYGIEALHSEPFQTLSDKDMSKVDIIYSLENAIKKSEIEGVVSADLTSKYDITLDYENRITIKIGNSTNIGYKISYASSVLDGKIGETADGYLIIDGSSEASFVPRESMDEYKKNSEAAIEKYRIGDKDGNSDADSDSGNDGSQVTEVKPDSD